MQLPPAAPTGAGDSISDALAAAGGDQSIVAAASAAFDEAYLVVLVVIAVVLVGRSAVTGWLLRRYTPGSQSQAHPGH